MPVFLTTDQIYRLLQREMPPNLYPDDPSPTSASGASGNLTYPGADSYATAVVLNSAYCNQSRIYANFWAQTADEKIGDWEVTFFGQPSSLPTLAQRQSAVLYKARNRLGIKPADMVTVVNNTVPGLVFDLIEWGGGTGGAIGAWLLDYSELDAETFLGLGSGPQPYGPGLCSQNWAEWGLTQAQWEALQEQAYTYEIRIYTTVLTAAQMAALDAALTVAEPARSTHVITDGLSISLKI